jgi:hypothetical protein
MLGRRRFLGSRRFIVAAIAVVFAVGSILWGITAPPSRAADGCPDFEFIGGRGSGESPRPDDPSPDYSEANQFGMGTLLFTVYDQLRSLVGSDRVAAHGVRYPAVGLTDSVRDYLNAAGAFLHIKPLGAYTDSVREGAQNVQDHIESRHSECPSTRFILAGYSQGAQAVGNALQRMPLVDRQLVVGAAFFGDPYFNARSWSSRASDANHHGVLGVRGEWPESLHGEVFSYCRPHDPICGISKRVHILGDGDVYVRDFPWFRGFTPHEQYASSGDATDAARQLARVLGATTPVTGTVPLDLAFAIDTTGSMGGVIGEVRDNVTALARSIASTSTNYRFGLVDYKDGPEQRDAYRARVDLGFTNDVGAFASAAASLVAEGGGDLPESVYSGVMTALDLPWRNGVRKVVLAIGDAPGKDPEPETGYTLETVRAKALAVDPAQVYTVVSSTDPSTTSFMSEMATVTGGKAYSTAGTADLVATLQAAIVAAGSAPVADVGGPYTGITGDPVTLSAGGSRDEAETIAAYDWDFNGDGTYDLTTEDPIVDHAYDASGTHNVVMRARGASGLAGTATSTVTMTDPPAAPGTPQSLTAVPGDGSVTLKWERGAGGSATWYTITDGAGTELDRVAALSNGEAPVGWVDTNLTNGTAYSYRVSAGNPAGESAATGPVTATPGTANRPPRAAADSYSTDIRTPLVVPAPGVLVNDADPDAGDVLTATLETPAAHGTVDMRSDGSFSYTPAAGFVGVDSFTYKAIDADGATSSPAQVDINVTPPAATKRQRLAFIAPGRHPVVVVGRLTAGGFTIQTTGHRVDSITGTGTVSLGRGKTATVELDVRRTGAAWVGTATVKLPSSRKTFVGTGIVKHTQRLTLGAFGKGKQRYAFAIVEPRPSP